MDRQGTSTIFPATWHNQQLAGEGYLAGRAGIRQFLDIGTGLPTAGSVHEVAKG